MRRQRPNPSEQGFSLVELMIVVGIIGVLATMALPRFKQFQAKAKLGEAKNILSHIYTLEHSFAVDNNKFIPFGPMGSPGADANCVPNSGAAQIGFRIDPCNRNVPRFAYSAVLEIDETKFTARAVTGAGAENKVCQGNPSFTIEINQDKKFGGSNADANGETSVGKVCEE